jgi:alpha-N-arabinofuranosidase
MIKTPTYHVFDLLKEHQDGNFVPITWEREPEEIQKNLPHVDLSSSIKEDTLTVSLVNLSAEREAGVELELLAAKPVSASGRLLKGKPTAHNTFTDPCHVDTANLEGITLKEGIIGVSLPPCAIASLEIKLG